MTGSMKNTAGRIVFPTCRAKLQRESIRYKEVVELADVLGYELVWQKRRDNV